MPIQHIWFDFNDTLVEVDHKDLDLHAVDRKLPESFSSIHKTHTAGEVSYNRPTHVAPAQTNAVFGPQQDPWEERVKNAARQGFFKLRDPESPHVLAELSKLIKVSVFSNMDTRTILQGLGIDTSLFTHILSPHQNSQPKPHPDAYRRIIEASGVAPDQILYIGNDVEKDVRPVKTLGIKAGLMWGESPEADYHFRQFQEVLDFVRQANS